VHYHRASSSEREREREGGGGKKEREIEREKKREIEGERRPWWVCRRTQTQSRCDTSLYKVSLLLLVFPARAAAHCDLQNAEVTEEHAQPLPKARVTYPASGSALRSCPLNTLKKQQQQ